MAGKKTVEKNENIKTETSFTKVQLISAKKYTHQRDMLNVLLKDESAYSFKEVDDLIEEFLQKEVK